MMQSKVVVHVNDSKGGFNRFTVFFIYTKPKYSTLMEHFLLKTRAFLLSLAIQYNFFYLAFCRSLKITISLFLLLFCNMATQAQDKEKFFHHDSAAMYHLPNDTVENAEDSSDTEPELVVADTILVNNGLFIPTDSATAIKKEKAFAYASILDSLLKELQLKQDVKYTVNTKRISTIDRFFSARLTKLFFWIIAALLLSFIIIKLFITESFFQRKSAGSNVNVLATDEDAVPDARDYQSQINAAIQKGDFRLATRYLYLQLLYRLIVLGAISFATDKTNNQYVAELAAKPYHKAFAALTLQYEYAWYGGFILDENRFNAIRQSFIKFNNQLPTLH